jgi:hypothetical protein
MKKVPKILGWAFLVLIRLLAVGITFTIGWRRSSGPRARPLTNVRFQSTPERLARGRYLVEHLTACMLCHSPHDWTKRDAPTPLGMEAGGQDMSFLKGLPGRIVAPNISPDPETGDLNWTNDMLARAIREGIGHEGRAVSDHALPGLRLTCRRRPCLHHRPLALATAAHAWLYRYHVDWNDPVCLG